MFTIAVTGGLGAGKSTAARFFAAHGAHIIALDEVARATLVGDPQVLAQVVAHFGESVVGADGRLDRPALAKAAFGTADAAHVLNSIVHPAAIRETERQLAELAASAPPPAVVVLEVPLLAEAPALLEDADEVLAIAAPIDARVARAVERGMAESDARRRIEIQATDADRAAIADAVVENDSDEASFEAALTRYWDERVAPHVDPAP